MVLAHRVPYPPNKGEKLRSYHQLRYLSQKGCRITVCAPISDSSDEADLDALRLSLNVTTIGQKIGNRHLRLLRGAVTAQPLSVSNFYGSGLQDAIDARLASQPVDVIMCTSSCMAKYVFSSQTLSESTRMRSRLIMDFMDLDSDKWQQYAKLRGLPASLIFRREARLLASYERRIHNTFDECVFVSKHEAELFAQSPGVETEKLHAIGNGVDPEQFYPAEESPPHGSVHLLFVGVMDYFPNEDAMIWFVETMWPTIHKRWSTSTLSIVGMRPSKRIKSLSTVAGVEVVGFVDDVLPWFHRATIFVAPFRIARGVQNKILQAFAAGVPVVTTSLGAEGIACNANVELLVADDCDGFIEHVNCLAESPEFGTEIRNRALSLVENEYSWNSQNERLHNLLKLPNSKT